MPSKLEAGCAENWKGGFSKMLVLIAGGCLLLGIILAIVLVVTLGAKDQEELDGPVGPADCTVQNITMTKALYACGKNDEQRCADYEVTVVYKDAEVLTFLVAAAAFPAAATFRPDTCNERINGDNEAELISKCFDGLLEGSEVNPYQML